LPLRGKLVHFEITAVKVTQVASKGVTAIKLITKNTRRETTHSHPNRGVTRGARFHGRRKVSTMPQLLSSTARLLPKDLSFEHGGRQTCFLPRAPSNLGTPLHPKQHVRCTLNHKKYITPAE